MLELALAAAPAYQRNAQKQRQGTSSTAAAQTSLRSSLSKRLSNTLDNIMGPRGRGRPKGKKRGFRGADRYTPSPFTPMYGPQPRAESSLEGEFTARGTPLARGFGHRNSSSVYSQEPLLHDSRMDIDGDDEQQLFR